MPNPWLLPMRQFEVYQIVENAEDPPRLSDIAEAMKISKSTAHRHVEVLMEKGYLVRERGFLKIVPYEKPALDAEA